MKIEEGPYPIPEMHKIEYETLCAFGSLLLNDDLFTILKINDLLNRAGMDSISCGGTVAFAIECFEKGILNPEDTGGLELRWGNAPAILALTEKIIRREGLGDLLADGVKRAAEKLGRARNNLPSIAEEWSLPCMTPNSTPGSERPMPANRRRAATPFPPTPIWTCNFWKKNSPGLQKVPFLTTHKEKYRTDNKGEAQAVDSFYKMLIDGAGACLFGTQIGGNYPALRVAERGYRLGKFPGGVSGHRRTDRTAPPGL